jgi:hypothetical protein
MADLPEVPDRDGRLRELLLRYLLAARLPDWPGADGTTLDAVLLTYAVYAAVDRVPGRAILLLWHPELAPEIEDFFAPGANFGGGDGGPAGDASRE